jgi:hypothetical protein
MTCSCNVFCLFLTLTIFALFLPNTHAKFNEEACVSCLTAENWINSTYCEVSDGTYHCLTASEGGYFATFDECTGRYYSVALECTDFVEDAFKVAGAVLITIVVLSILCCLACIGGIIALVFYCARKHKNGRALPSAVVDHGHQYPSPPKPLVLPGTLQMTPAQTGVVTAVEEPYPLSHPPTYPTSYHSPSSAPSFGGKADPDRTTNFEL